MVPGVFTNQIHDFNPGVSPEGVFWTVPFPKHAIEIDFKTGEEDADEGDGQDDESSARARVEGFRIHDWGSIPNSLTLQAGGINLPPNAQVSFDMSWHGAIRRVHRRVEIPNGDDEQHFVGDYLLDNASIKWSATEEGFSFHSTSSKSLFALIGHERNGTFFR